MSLGAGMVRYFSGECALAKPQLQAYLAAHPSEEIPAYWIGTCDSKEGDWQAAFHVWEAAGLVRPLQDAAALLASQQKWQLASSAYQALLTLTPYDCLYRERAVSAAWYADNDAPKAIPQLEGILSECPNEAEAYLVLGRILIADGQFDRAGAALIKAHDLMPDSDSPLTNLAQLRLRQKRPQDAFALLQSALLLDPQRANTFALLGTTDTALGQPDPAVKAYQTAIQLGLNEAWVYEGLGVSYETLGEKDNARAAYQRAVTLEPNRTFSLARLAKLATPR